MGSSLSVETWTWTTRDNAFVVFCGADEFPDGWRSELAPDSRSAPVLELGALEPGYPSFGGLDLVLAEMLPVARRSAPALLDTYAHVIKLFTDPAERDGLGRIVPLAESAALGTTRRISRESHDSAKIIDAVARFTAEVVRDSAEFPHGAILAVRSLDTWDRPSLRVLHRAVLLSAPGAPVSVAGLCRPVIGASGAAAPSRPRGDAPQQRMDAMRGQFLTGLTERPGGRLVTAGNSTARFPADGVDLRPGERTESLLRSIGEALSFQNFEHALVLTEAAYPVVDGGTAVQVRRLAAISDAQRGDPDGARRQLSAALESSRDPVVNSHLHYLVGLLLTKRSYDLDSAVQHFTTGRALAAERLEDDPVARIEYAWLLNGEALVSTLRGKSAGDEETQENHYTDAFDKAFEAFQLTREESGMSAHYLRHNLAANLTFLLEITSRLTAARSFWERAMAVPRKVGSSEFLLPYELRIGVLLCKEGRSAEALNHLRNALHAARELNDAFYEERVLAALGYAALAAGELTQAATSYTEGLRVAARLRDRNAQVVHATGLLRAAALGHRLPESAWIAGVHGWPEATRDALVAAAGSGALAATMERLELTPQVPAPKLPPYIPEVDLEGSPQRDLNRVLVGNVPGSAKAGVGVEDGR